jgi:hypothetical protein
MVSVRSALIVPHLSGVFRNPQSAIRNLLYHSPHAKQGNPARLGKQIVKVAYA